MQLLQDLRVATRSLLRTPAFTALSTGVLGLGLAVVVTMFGILWGIVSIVLLSAMGEGFRRGNEAVFNEFGKNVGIVWGGRTSLQAGGERAGRQVLLTVADDGRGLEGRGMAMAAATGYAETVWQVQVSLAFAIVSASVVFGAAAGWWSTGRTSPGRRR